MLSSSSIIIKIRQTTLRPISPKLWNSHQYKHNKHYKQEGKSFLDFGVNFCQGTYLMLDLSHSMNRWSSTVSINCPNILFIWCLLSRWLERRTLTAVSANYFIHYCLWMYSAPTLNTLVGKIITMQSGSAYREQQASWLISTNMTHNYSHQRHCYHQNHISHHPHRQRQVSQLSKTAFPDFPLKNSKKWLRFGLRVAHDVVLGNIFVPL